ncbi:MAG: hypothetical protein EXR81_02130 [Gammaproteobacteria bacterium]|nr:hypothetical protein [Gammaproteobacteria bacterium]
MYTNEVGRSMSMSMLINKISSELQTNKAIAPLMLLKNSFQSPSTRKMTETLCLPLEVTIKDLLRLQTRESLFQDVDQKMLKPILTILKSKLEIIYREIGFMFRTLHLPPETFSEIKSLINHLLEVNSTAIVGQARSRSDSLVPTYSTEAVSDSSGYASSHTNSPLTKKFVFPSAPPSPKISAGTFTTLEFTNPFYQQE